MVSENRPKVARNVDAVTARVFALKRVSAQKGVILISKKKLQAIAKLPLAFIWQLVELLDEFVGK